VIQPMSVRRKRPHRAGVWVVAAGPSRIVVAGGIHVIREIRESSRPVSWLVPISNPRAAPRRVGWTNLRSVALLEGFATAASFVNLRRSAMDFFDRQEHARRQTTLLLAYFAAAVVVIIVLTYFVFASVVLPFLKPLPHGPRIRSIPIAIF